MPVVAELNNESLIFILNTPHFTYNNIDNAPKAEVVHHIPRAKTLEGSFAHTSGGIEINSYSKLRSAAPADYNPGGCPNLCLRDCSSQGAEWLEAVLNNSAPLIRQLDELDKSQ